MWHGGIPLQDYKLAKVRKPVAVKYRKPVAVKYRKPEMGEIWTGRGQMTTWLKAMEAAGRKREEFLVG